MLISELPRIDRRPKIPKGGKGLGIGAVMASDMPGIVLVIDGDAVRVVGSPIIPAAEGLGDASAGLLDRTTAAVSPGRHTGRGYAARAFATTGWAIQPGRWSLTIPIACMKA